MFQVLENQVTNNRLFLDDSESGAGPDLNKPCWPWIYFVNSHQVLPSLYSGGLGSLYRVCSGFFAVNWLGNPTGWEDVSSSPRPASFGSECGMAVCLWPASLSGLRLPLHASSSSGPNGYCKHWPYCCL